MGVWGRWGSGGDGSQCIPEPPGEGWLPPSSAHAAPPAPQVPPGGAWEVPTVPPAPLGVSPCPDRAPSPGPWDSPPAARGATGATSRRCTFWVVPLGVWRGHFVPNTVLPAKPAESSSVHPCGIELRSPRLTCGWEMLRSDAARCTFHPVQRAASSLQLEGSNTPASQCSAEEPGAKSCALMDVSHTQELNVKGFLKL